MTGRLAVLLLLAAGCGTWRPAWLPEAPGGAVSTEARLEHARIEAGAGRPKNAVVLYENVIRDHAGEEVAAEAMHDLAMLRLEPRSAVRDHRSAYQLLSRLAREHPKTRWGREAKAWRLVLQQVDRCEAEATRLGADAERLRQTIESLKDADVDLEELP